MVRRPKKVAFHSTTNTISIYDGSLREKLATIKCDSLKAFSASPRNDTLWGGRVRARTKRRTGDGS